MSVLTLEIVIHSATFNKKRHPLVVSYQVGKEMAWQNERKTSARSERAPDLLISWSPPAACTLHYKDKDNDLLKAIFEEGKDRIGECLIPLKDFNAGDVTHFDAPIRLLGGKKGNGCVAKFAITLHAPSRPRLTPSDSGSSHSSSLHSSTTSTTVNYPEGPVNHIFEKELLGSPTRCFACNDFCKLHGMRCKFCISLVHDSCMNDWNQKVPCYPTPHVHYFIKKPHNEDLPCRVCSKKIHHAKILLCLHCKSALHEACLEEGKAMDCKTAVERNEERRYKCKNCKENKCWWAVQLPEDQFPIPVLTGEESKKDRKEIKKKIKEVKADISVEKQAIGLVLTEEYGEELFGCRKKSKCTCDCMVGSSIDNRQKTVAIVGGLALAGAAIGATVVTAGAAAPATAAACAVVGGMVAGVGISAAVHGAMAKYKGKKINPRDFGIDLGIGALGGAAAGGIAVVGAFGVGVAATYAATAGASTAAVTGVSVVGLGATGAVSAASADVIRDKVDIATDRKDALDEGNTRGLAVAGGAVGGGVIGGAGIAINGLSSVTNASMAAQGSAQSAGLSGAGEVGGLFVGDIAAEKWHERDVKKQEAKERKAGRSTHSETATDASSSSHHPSPHGTPSMSQSHAATPTSTTHPTPATANMNAHASMNAHPTAHASMNAHPNMNMNAGMNAHPNMNVNAGMNAHPTMNVNPGMNAHPNMHVNANASMGAHPSMSAHPTMSANASMNAHPSASMNAHPSMNSYPSASNAMMGNVSASASASMNAPPPGHHMGMGGQMGVNPNYNMGGMNYPPPTAGGMNSYPPPGGYYQPPTGSMNMNYQQPPTGSMNMTGYPPANNNMGGMNPGMNYNNNMGGMHVQAHGAPPMQQVNTNDGWMHYGGGAVGGMGYGYSMPPAGQ